MHFSMLLCHFIHWWKDFSGMLLGFAITALLMASIPFKTGLELGGKKSHSQEMSDAQHTQSCYFWDIPKFLVIIFVLFHVQLTCDYLKSTDNCHTPPALPTQYWSLSWLLKTYSWSNFSLPCDPLWTSCVTQKRVCDNIISIHLLKQFVLVSNWTKNFRLIHSLFLAAEQSAYPSFTHNSQSCYFQTLYYKHSKNLLNMYLLIIIF